MSVGRNSDQQNIKYFPFIQLNKGTYCFACIRIITINNDNNNLWVLFVDKLTTCDKSLLAKGEHANQYLHIPH